MLLFSSVSSIAARKTIDIKMIELMTHRVIEVTLRNVGSFILASLLLRLIRLIDPIIIEIRGMKSRRMMLIPVMHATIGFSKNISS